MAHEKVFGFCENLCEVEVEKTSNKVTSVSSSSTDTQYPSAKAVYDTFEKASNKVNNVSSSSTDDQYPSAKSVYGMLNGLLGGNGDNWKNTTDSRAMWYYYEGANTSTLDLPSATCIVVVFQKFAIRGVALALGWDGTSSTNKTVWKNTNQDGWKGWTQLHSN